MGELDELIERLEKEANDPRILRELLEIEEARRKTEAERRAEEEREWKRRAAMTEEEKQDELDAVIKALEAEKEHEADKTTEELPPLQARKKRP